MADSGASINILDDKEYHKLPNRPNLEPSNVKIYGYQSKVTLRVLGKFTITLESEAKGLSDKLYVVESCRGICWLSAKLENITRTQPTSNG